MKLFRYSKIEIKGIMKYRCKEKEYIMKKAKNIL